LGSLLASVGLAFDDKFVVVVTSRSMAPLGEQRVAHHAEAFRESQLLVITVEVLRCRSTTSS
jgi:hypothetical protein